MTRKTKLIFMFSPFVLFFVGLAILVNDLRHPALTGDDSCVVTAIGKDVQSYKSQGHEIYRQSNNPQNDVSLHCNRFGTLLLNDAQMFITPVKSGQGAQVQLKEYQVLPKRWMVSVHTGKEKK